MRGEYAVLIFSENARDSSDFLEKSNSERILSYNFILNVVIWIFLMYSRLRQECERETDNGCHYNTWNDQYGALVSLVVRKYTVANKCPNVT